MFTVTPNPLDGNDILHPLGDAVRLFILPQNLLDRFHAYSLPPFRVWKATASFHDTHYKEQNNQRKTDCFHSAMDAKLYPKPPQILRNFRSELTSSCLHPKWDISS